MSGVLTIAGSDSGGGAGIQADLKTMTLLGGHGMSVITAVTAQNSSGVRGAYAIPLPMIESQIDAIFSDMKVDAVKTGMLSDADVVGMVAQKMHHYRVENLVVDPVMVAKDGSPLLSEAGQDAVKRTLLPCALLVTPNIPEASVLTGLAVTTEKEMRETARRIHDLGPRAVLLKGGHLAGDPVDILFDGSSFETFACARIGQREVHGTGCVLSAAIATYVSLGFPLAEAVEKAITFLRAGIRMAMTPGQGRPFVNFPAIASRERERQEVITTLQGGFSALQSLPGATDLIPEVASNFGYALPMAQGFEDVAAFPGRIVRCGDTLDALAGPRFGVSQHVAAVILTVMQYDPSYRSAINIRFSSALLRACEKAGFRVRSFSRTDEPAAIARQEGRSLEWGTDHVLSREQDIPDAIFDEGGWGKEPMIRVVGKDPQDIVHKLTAILREKSW